MTGFRFCALGRRWIGRIAGRFVAGAGGGLCGFIIAFLLGNL